MAVAKSFKNFEILGEPFDKNGKPYVTVRNPSTKNTRTVRWYTDAEYAKMYPEEKKPIDFCKIFGFQKGYITIYPDVSIEDEWFLMSDARYAIYWGWYFRSIDELPQNIPQEGIKLLKEEVLIDDYTLKSKKEIAAIVNAKKYCDKDIDTEYFGKPGERVNLTVEIVRENAVTTQYGKKVYYLMKDKDNHIFQWFTAPKNLHKGDTWKMRGTIKEHVFEEGLKKTILLRCVDN